MYWMFLPLRRTFDFAGRSRRMEFWAFCLLPCVVLLGLAFAVFQTLVTIGQTGDTGHAVDDMAGTLGWVIPGFGLIWLALLLPTIGVQMRRFHDQDKTGWLVALHLVPCIGSLIVLLFMCIAGTPGANRYGPDPRGGGQG